MAGFSQSLTSFLLCNGADNSCRSIGYELRTVDTEAEPQRLRTVESMAEPWTQLSFLAFLSARFSTRVFAGFFLSAFFESMPLAMMLTPRLGDLGQLYT